MDRVSGRNARNESQIEFVSDDCTKYNSTADFYATVIRLLGDGWDSDATTEKHIRNAVQVSRSLSELQRKVTENLGITPIPSFSPRLDEATEIYSFRDDWNVQEFVWLSDGRYHFMGWDTSA